MKEKQEFDKLQGKDILIGIDPGRKDIASCVKKDLVLEEEEAISLSNAQYYNDSKMNERIKKMNTYIRESGLGSWINSMPSFKCFFINDFEENIRKIFVPELTALIRMKNQRKVKKLRWRCFIHKYKTLDSFCQKLLKHVYNKSQVAVCFGDASFNHASKGSPPSPRRLWLKKRLEKNHNVTCIDIWEFNTSQICSNCHNPEKMEGCTTARNPHYVRRCQSCRTLWNRDVNAARNMVFLGGCIQNGKERPIFFKKSVPKSTKRPSETLGMADQTAVVELVGVKKRRL